MVYLLEIIEPSKEEILNFSTKLKKNLKKRFKTVLGANRNFKGFYHGTDESLWQVDGYKFKESNIERHIAKIILPQPPKLEVGSLDLLTVEIERLALMSEKERKRAIARLSEEEKKQIYQRAEEDLFSVNRIKIRVDGINIRYLEGREREAKFYSLIKKNGSDLKKKKIII